MTADTAELRAEAAEIRRSLRDWWGRERQSAMHPVAPDDAARLDDAADELDALRRLEAAVRRFHDDDDHFEFKDGRGPRPRDSRGPPSAGAAGRWGVKKPRVEVHVMTWSKNMKLKRRHEVLLTDGGDWISADNAIPVARFETRAEADLCAETLRAQLAPMLGADHA